MREEEIVKESEKNGINTIRQDLIENLPEETIKLIDDLMIISFEKGAEWADKNPINHYNISDIDYVHTVLECIENIASRTTSGNVSHNASEIKLMARCALNTFNKIVCEKEQ